ncbi:MAG: metalloregulator ArsR/SmtB family transcription factor [Chromatiales bacterium]|jgi:DNA-binding transcriptional ArsR family regulator|nr:metalloregulator ArsR/SmtB family transcription factor [Chromatiales bacterium]
MERVFKALADGTRRRILDRLFDTDSLSLGELCSGLEMSRQAVSKHLGILETAGLVVAVRRGREKRHFLNPVPIQQIGDRWIAKYARKQARAITALKGALEEGSHDAS